jgi:hypothetical protein
MSRRELGAGGGRQWTGARLCVAPLGLRLFYPPRAQVFVGHGDSNRGLSLRRRPLYPELRVHCPSFVAAVAARAACACPPPAIKEQQGNQLGGPCYTRRRFCNLHASGMRNPAPRTSSRDDTGYSIGVASNCAVPIGVSRRASPISVRACRVCAYGRNTSPPAGRSPIAKPPPHRTKASGSGVDARGELPIPSLSMRTAGIVAGWSLSDSATCRSQTPRPQNHE